MPRQTKSLGERLAEKSQKVGDCILWTGGLDAYGYGQLSNSHRGKLKAHRVAWELRNGAIPVGLGVLHRCDTPACINPDHLFLGTQTDNRADCVQKKRHRVPTPPVLVGEKNPSAKLTDAQRDEVWALRISMTQYQLAERFGVTQSTISRIIGRRILAPT